MRFSRSSEMLSHITLQLTVDVSGHHLLPITCHAVKCPKFILVSITPENEAETSVAIDERMLRNIYNIPEDFRFQVRSGINLKSSVFYLQLH
jgi:hypothetical protein